MAEKTLAGQGIGAWPVCGKFGYTVTITPNNTTPLPSGNAAEVPAPVVDVTPIEQR